MILFVENKKFMIYVVEGLQCNFYERTFFVVEILKKFLYVL